jgi:7-cyano-7-deazaguanine reductase
MIYEDRVEDLSEKKAKAVIGRFAKISDIDISILKTLDYEYPEREIEVQMTTDEFTCVCPFSGLPDFAKLTITYAPAKKIVEMKSLKYYLYAFRGVKVYNEHVANKILEDLSKLLKPRRMFLVMEFTNRGGICNKVTATYRGSR